LASQFSNGLYLSSHNADKSGLRSSDNVQAMTVQLDHTGNKLVLSQILMMSQTSLFSATIMLPGPRIAGIDHHVLRCFQINDGRTILPSHDG